MSLRARFVVWFAFAALLPIAGAVGMMRLLLSRQAGIESARILEQAAASTQALLDAERQRLGRDLDLLADPRHPAWTSLWSATETGADGRPKSPDAAPTWLLPTTGLDALFALGPNDQALIIPHAPAAQGRPQARLAALARPEGAPSFAWLDATHPKRGKRWMLVGGRLLLDRGRSFTVGAGRDVTTAIVASLARIPGVEARIVVGGQEIAGSMPTWRPDAEHHLTRPLPTAPGEPTAALELALSTGSVETTLGDMTLAGIVLGAMALVGALLLGILVSRPITRRVEVLVDGALAVARGDLAHSVPVTSNDELGTLAATFNHMTAELGESKTRLAHAERLAAWQDVARHLAHEIKNPLTPIQMSMETLRKSHEKQHPDFAEILSEATAAVLDEVARLKRIVGEFSQFARTPKPMPTRVDVGELVHGALSLYQGSTELRWQPPTDSPTVFADRDQLTQLLLNLLENAREASAGATSPRIELRSGLTSDGTRAYLEVEDNGPGIAPEIREKLFSPYVTTKAAGTGLGLAIAQRIAVEHGGRLTVTSGDTLGGALFRLELPVFGAKLVSGSVSP